VEQIETTPSSELGWTALQVLEAQQEGSSLSLWERMKAEARAELLGGYRAAEVVTNRRLHAYEFARFVVLWERLAAEWQPRGGLEEVLLDQLAQLHTLYGYWLTVSYDRCQKEYHEPTDLQKRYELPRVDEQQAQEHAAAMADRYQRMFMRALRNLRDLRRHPVIVQNAGQVNVAAQGGQQINVAQSGKSNTVPTAVTSMP
jgi:hypothetical protein